MWDRNQYLGQETEDICIRSRHEKRPTKNIMWDRNQYLGQETEDICISSSHEKRLNVNEKRPTIPGIPAAAVFGTETGVQLQGDIL
jgi:hypothetical protein